MWIPQCLKFNLYISGQQWDTVMTDLFVQCLLLLEDAIIYVRQYFYCLLRPRVDLEVGTEMRRSGPRRISCLIHQLVPPSTLYRWLLWALATARLQQARDLCCRCTMNPGIKWPSDNDSPIGSFIVRDRMTYLSAAFGGVFSKGTTVSHHCTAIQMQPLKDVDPRKWETAMLNKIKSIF